MARGPDAGSEPDAVLEEHSSYCAEKGLTIRADCVILDAPTAREEARLH